MSKVGILAPGRLIWHLARLAPRLNGLHLLVQLIRNLLILAPGLILRELFDYLDRQGVPQDEPLTLLPWGLLALLLTVGVLRGVTIVAATYSQSTVWGYDTGRIRANLLDRLLARPNAADMPLPAGDAANRLSVDVGEVGQFVSSSYDIFASATLALISLLIMLWVEWTVAIFATIPLLLIAIVLRLAQNRLEHFRSASRAAQGEVTAFLGEMFGAVEAVKVAAAEEHVLKQFRQLNAARKESVLRERLFEQLNVLAIFNNIANFAIGLILLLAAAAMRVGPDGPADFSVGDFSLFVYLMAQVADFMLSGSWWLAQWRQQRASLLRLAPLLGREGELPQPAKLAPAVPFALAAEREQLPLPAGFGQQRLQRLAVTGLSYHYPTSGQGIHDISFALTAGTVNIITGPIGAGKTTLLYAALGLLPATGAIYWNEELVEAPASFFKPPFVALVPQIPQLLSDTLAENIRLGLPVGEAALHEAVAKAILEPDVTQLADGLATQVGPRGVKLSGGQIQRAAAARLFIRQPALVVCDDLSSALDATTEARLWQQLLTEAARRPACLLVSHNRPVWRRADQILLLDQGRLVDKGRLSELLDRSALMRQLWAEAG